MACGGYSSYRRILKYILSVEGFSAGLKCLLKVLYPWKACRKSSISIKLMEDIQSPNNIPRNPVKAFCSQTTPERISIHRRFVEDLIFIKDLWKMLYPQKACEWYSVRIKIAKSFLYIEGLQKILYSYKTRGRCYILRRVFYPYKKIAKVFQLQKACGRYSIHKIREGLCKVFYLQKS